MKKLLIISSSLPPYFTGGTPRLIRWCKNLPKFGWQVALAGFSGLPSQAQVGEAPPGVPIYAAEYPRAKRLASKVRRVLGTEKAKSDWFPDAMAEFIPLIAKEVQRAIRSEEPDAIMITVPSFSLMDERLLSAIREVSDAPLVLDQRDLMFANAESELLTSNKEKVEEFVFRAAKFFALVTHVHCVGVAMSEPYFQEAALLEVPNSWEAESYREFDSGEDWPGHAQGEFRIVFVGMINSVRSPIVFRDAIRLLGQDLPEIVNDLRFEIYGQATPEGLGDWGDLSPILIFNAPIPYSQIPRLLCGADVVAFALQDTCASSFTPGAKIYEYVGARRPILAVTNGAARDIVSETQSGLVADPNDAADVAEKLKELYLLWRDDQPFEFGSPELTLSMEATGVCRKLSTALNEIVVK